MNRVRFWAPLMVLVFVTPLHAILIDFNEPPATYNVGSSFILEGIQFQVIGYNGVGSSISLNGTGADRHLSMNNSIGINVDVPSNTGLVEFRFADFCSSCSTTGITVNGQASNPTIQLTALDGTTLGGVQIDVIPGPAAFQTMRLIGPITSFATGGTEYLFDNLRIAVPEPGSYTMVLVGLALTLIRR